MVIKINQELYKHKKNSQLNNSTDQKKKSKNVQYSGRDDYLNTISYLVGSNEGKIKVFFFDFPQKCLITSHNNYTNLRDKIANKQLPHQHKIKWNHFYNC